MRPEIFCSNVNQIHWGNESPGSFDVNNTVHLWRANISAYASRSAFFEQVLSKDELEKRALYRHEIDKERFTIGRGILRMLLSKYLDLPASLIEFGTDDNRKPIVLNSTRSPIHFNLSHSGDMQLIAVSDKPVGVDLEYINDQFAFAELLPLYFSEAERSYINNSPNALSDFYKLWTRKEALIKATGKALDSELALVPCLDGTHETTGEFWEVHSFEAATQYSGSIACAQPIDNIYFMETAALL